MKNLVKRFVSIIKPDNNYRRKEYLVVDMSKQSTAWGGFLDGTRIVAFKCDEFATLEEAQNFVDQNVPKNELSYIEIFKRI